MGNVLFNVPVKFDGRSIRDYRSDRGYLVFASIVDFDGDGAFSLEHDAVLVAMPHPGRPVTSENLPASPEEWAKLSRDGSGVLTHQDLERAGLAVAADMDHDGKIDLHSRLELTCLREMKQEKRFRFVATFDARKGVYQFRGIDRHTERRERMAMAVAALGALTSVGGWFTGIASLAGLVSPLTGGLTFLGGALMVGLGLKLGRS